VKRRGDGRALIYNSVQKGKLGEEEGGGRGEDSYYLLVRLPLSGLGDARKGGKLLKGRGDARKEKDWDLGIFFPWGGGAQRRQMTKIDIFAAVCSRD